MKPIVVVFISLFLPLGPLVGQSIEIECTITRISGDYLTLQPAHFDPNVLPKIGDNVVLFLYAKDNLPVDKKEGYYRLGNLETMKLLEESRLLQFKLILPLNDLNGISQKKEPMLRAGDRVKISWVR